MHVCSSLQTVVRLSCTRSGATEQFVFHAELTNRDKDHVSRGKLAKIAVNKVDQFSDGTNLCLHVCMSRTMNN